MVKLLRDLELVSRYDWLIQPINAPGGDHEKRLTLGVDYWLTPAVVVRRRSDAAASCAWAASDCA